MLTGRMSMSHRVLHTLTTVSMRFVNHSWSVGVYVEIALNEANMSRSAVQISPQSYGPVIWRGTGPWRSWRLCILAETLRL
jgi:hypothetical protein